MPSIHRHHTSMKFNKPHRTLIGSTYVLGGGVGTAVIIERKWVSLQTPNSLPSKQHIHLSNE